MESFLPWNLINNQYLDTVVCRNFYELMNSDPSTIAKFREWYKLEFPRKRNMDRDLDITLCSCGLYLKKRTANELADIYGISEPRAKQIIIKTIRCALYVWGKKPKKKSKKLIVRRETKFDFSNGMFCSEPVETIYI